MKAILLVATFLTSFTAFSAEDPSFLLKFWNSRYEIVDTLFDNYGRGEGYIPNTGVRTSHQTHYIKLHKACVEGEMVRSVNPVKTCAQRGYKQVNCGDDHQRSADGNCYDRDQKICTKYVMEYGYAPIVSDRKKCANYSDKEARDWRRKNNRDDFKKDFPRCSVFKTFKSTKRTSFNFDIVKNVGKNSSRYDNRYKGDLVMNVDIELPTCTNGTM